MNKQFISIGKFRVKVIDECKTKDILYELFLRKLSLELVLEILEINYVIKFFLFYTDLRT